MRLARALAASVALGAGALAPCGPLLAAGQEEPQPPPPAKPPAREPRREPRPRVPPHDRVRLHLEGGFAPLSMDFRETRRFTEFAEEGTLDVDYANPGGPGFDAGVRYAFTRQFAVGASVTRFSRSGSGTFTAALPHPLYLDHDRSAEGRLEDLHYTESALYLDLVYLARAGKAELSFFAGPTFFRVRASLVDRVDYAHSYPFDSVTVTDVPDSAFEDQAAGWHAGAAVDFHVSPRVGLGAQARFTRAQAELAPAAGQNVSLDAGGLQLTAGVRVFF